MKRYIFHPGEVVMFEIPGCKMLGIVSHKNYAVKPHGIFQIRIIYIYKNNKLHPFQKIGDIGGNFTHSRNNNLRKLSFSTIKRLGPLIMLALY